MSADKDGEKRSSKESIVKRLERIEEGIARAKALKQNTQTASPVSTAPSDGSGAYQRKITHGRCTVCRSNENSQPCSKQLGATPLGQVWVSGQKFAAICSRNGIPHFTSLGEKYIYSQTGQWPHFHNESTFAFSEVTGQASSGTLAQKSLKGQAKQSQPDKLPEKWVAQALLDAFFKADFRLVFPIVDRELFEETIRQAYDAPDTNPTIEEIGSKACVFAFLAITGNHFSALDIAKYVDSDACSRQAQLLISDFIEDASLTTLQVMVILVGR
jgi:hypothetical protein